MVYTHVMTKTHTNTTKLARVSQAIGSVQAYERQYAEQYLDSLIAAIHHVETPFEHAIAYAKELIQALEMTGASISSQVVAEISEHLSTLLQLSTDQAAQSATQLPSLKEKLEYTHTLQDYLTQAFEMISEWEEQLVPHTHLAYQQV
jgi:predicted nucleic acid-binding protein